MTTESPHDRLSVTLEAAALRALSEAWEQLNHGYFHRLLRPPTIALADTRSRLGRWVGETRTLEIARTALLDHGWGAVVEVLKHEMAHQYVDEALGVREETAHGPTFQRVCAERGIDHRAAGAPEPRDGDTPEGERGKVLERVARLLALAGSPNIHEAQSAMNAAQKLMLKHNLEAVHVGRPRGYSFRHLGEPSGRIDESQRMLASILNDHFFVETIWVPVWRVAEGRRATVLEACGTPENLELAEYVHSFLHHTAERLWQEHKRDHGITGDRDRRAFRAGVMAGFRDKLVAQQRTSKEQGLVWLGDAELRRYYRQRHPHIRTARYGGSAGSEAHGHGREAGRNIVLHRGMKGSAPAGDRQLGPGRG